MRKRLLLGLGLFVLLGMAGFVALLWLTTPRNRINAENFVKIHKGMSKEVVEELIGIPGDYGTGEEFVFHSGVPPCWGNLKNAKTSWVSDEGQIEIYFGADGRAEGALFEPNFWVRESFLDKLRHWLHLPWW